jgi:predicted Zn-dependent protease
MVSPTIAKFGELAAGGLQVLFLSYGREDERQADKLGYDYALAQNYDVREMVNVFAALQQSAKLAGHSPVPSWLASHPYPEERIGLVEQRLQTLPATSQPRRIGEDEYLTHIDGLMYGPNPRNGYFEGNRFLHPELAFRLDMPEGWQTQNMAQFVVGGSPANDALIQLSLVQGGRAEAADTFFRQEGLTAGRLESERVNGMGATIGRFEAQTEQGTVGGVAAFISMDNRTFRILGYTPAEKLSGYENTFRRTINSFDQLTDRAALARQPDRLEIVRLPRQMTIAQFDRSYPSTIPLDELALINQLPSTDSQMPARYPAKRVVDH